MKFFTLYSAKYKKQVSNLQRGRIPLFTVLSFRTPRSAENLKNNLKNTPEKAHSECSTSDHCTNVAPLKETTTHLSMFPNKGMPCSRENEDTQERSRDIPYVDKKETAFLFVLYRILDILQGHQILQQYQMIGEIFIRFRAKLR